MARSPRTSLLILAAVALVAALARSLASPDGLGLPGDALIAELRLVRIGAAATIGVALAVSGALLQSLLRNPLASPYILGVTSGASLGVVLATYIAYTITGSTALYRQPIPFAFIGAAGAIILVYRLGRRRGEVEPVSLILVGVIVTVVLGAVTMFFQNLLSAAGLASTVRWMMGSISDEITPLYLLLVGALVVAGAVASFVLARALDAASLADDEAAGVGVNLPRLRALVFLIACALTAASVALAGPIGFVGLICPHIARLLTGATHRRLIPGAALTGAALMLLTETGTAMIRTPAGRIPEGVITAIVGGPVFIWLLKRSTPRS